MIELIARFVGTFRFIAGESEVTLSFKGKTCIGTVIQKIVEKFPKLKEVLIDAQQKRVISNALILLNGREIGVLNKLDTEVEDGDKMVFIPVSHGG